MCFVFRLLTFCLSELYLCRLLRETMRRHAALLNCRLQQHEREIVDAVLKSLQGVWLSPTDVRVSALTLLLLCLQVRDNYFKYFTMVVYIWYFSVIIYSAQLSHIDCQTSPAYRFVAHRRCDHHALFTHCHRVGRTGTGTVNLFILEWKMAKVFAALIWSHSFWLS